MMIGELKGQVTEACLIDLMDQLVRDTNFYMASNTALPNSPILTVTVKARTPLPQLRSGRPGPLNAIVAPPRGSTA